MRTGSTCRWGLASLIGLGLAACAPTTAPPSCAATTPPTPLVSAHRGGAAYAPENTLPAFQNALRLGVDQLELDTQLSQDGELVVIHDDTLDRTTSCSGTVGAMKLADIQACDAAYWFSPGQGVTAPDTALAHPLRGTGVKVPALRELLDWYVSLPCGRPSLSIEIKNIPGESNFDPAGDKTAKLLLPLLARYGLESEIVIQSFWPVTLNVVKQLNPRLKTQFLTSTGTGQTAAQNLAYVSANSHDISAPNYDAPDFNATLVQAAHAAGKAVLPYTVDSDAAQQAVIMAGVDGLITNFPACLLHNLHRAVPDPVTPEGVSGTPACPATSSPPQ